MIHSIKNCKICLISFFVFLFISCSTRNNVFIDWIDLTGGIAKGNVKITLSDGHGNISYLNLDVQKTNSVKVKSNLTITGGEHLSYYNLEIYSPKKLLNNSTIEIYLYPLQDVSQQENIFYLKQVKNVEAYFIELWDKKEKKNYYIISKDNIIDSNVVINKSISDFNYIIKNLHDDVAYYVNDEQEFPIPYNGYVVKSNIDNSYLFLSTLWGPLCPFPYYDLTPNNSNL